MAQATKYAIFDMGRVYHIARLGASPNGYDLTACGQFLLSKNGVKGPRDHFYAGGQPTPTMVDQPPPGLPLCQSCAKQLAKAAK